MRSGGDLIVSPVHGTHTVDINHAARDVREQLRRVETPEGLLRDEQRLPDHRRRVLHLLEPFGRGRPQPNGREGRLDRVRRPQVLPAGVDTETFNDRYWSASREPQRSMTSRGYDPRQSPGLGYKRVVSCKDSFHGTDVLAVSEHGAPGRRPNIHAHFVGRQREDGLDTLPVRAAEANGSTLIADIPFPAPENVAAKRCASEKRAF